MLTQGALVTIPRHYVAYILTEYAVAHLRGCSVKSPTEPLISTAHPPSRPDLRPAAANLLHL